MDPIRAFLPFLIFIFSSGCEASLRKLHEDRFLSHVGALKSYRGTLTEKGVLADGSSLVSDILYSKPGNYFVRVISPEKYQTILSYTGSRLVLFYPSTHYAVEFTHLKTPSETDQLELLQDAYNAELDRYRYDFGPAERVAGLSAITLEFEPKQPDTRISGGRTSVYDEFSFPLALRLDFIGGARYSYRYNQVAFNGEIPPTAFDLKLPEDTMVSRWDVDSKPYSLEQVAQEGQFRLKLPAKPPRQLALKKIIRQEGPVAAFTALYERGPYFFDVTAYKDFGLQPAPSGRGLKMNDLKGGWLVPGLYSTTYSFVDSGIRYLVVSNVPLDEFLRAMDGI